MYRPIAVLVVRFRFLVVAAAIVLMVATVPVFQRLGSEFMPPLDEGSLLVMPTTFPGIAIEEARRALVAQDRIIMGFPEVQSVHGKAGRAETATDPAQLDMIESVIALKPRDQWPTRYTARWYSAYAPDWAKQAVLRRAWPEQESRTMAQLARDLDGALQMPGYQMAIAPPIRTRIDMLTTGVRTPVGIKVFGDDLTEIERLSVSLEGMLRQVPGTRSTFAERQTGREYVDITPNRDVIARYGLTVRDVQDVVEAAVGGMPVSTAIAGRARFSINIRLAADYRADPQALRALLVPVASMGSLINAGDGTNTGAGVGALTAMGGASASSASGGGMGMGGGRAQAGAASPAMSASLLQPSMAGSAQAGPDLLEQWRQPGASVPLGQLADIRVTTGPPMIKDENGVLVGYVYADIDQTQRDLGGWVQDAKAIVASQLALPPGYRLQWTGQYEFLEEMEARLRYVIPLTLVLVVALLYMAMQGWPQTFLVLSSLPFAVAGSVWLLAYMDYNLSTAVWVGLIAVAGVAAETGIVMVVYLDEAFDALHAGGAHPDPRRRRCRRRRRRVRPRAAAADDGRDDGAGPPAAAVGRRRRRRRVRAHGGSGGGRLVVVHVPDPARPAGGVCDVAPRAGAAGRTRAAEHSRALAANAPEPPDEPVTPVGSVAPDAEMPGASAQAGVVVPGRPSPTDVTPAPKPTGDPEAPS